MRTLVISLLVLAAAAVGADRVAERVATGQAEDRLAAHGVTGPRVDVGGFPFVTQLLAHRFGEVTMSGAAVAVDRAHARKVHVRATDVEVPASGDATAGTLRATLLVTYREVVRRAGLAPMTLAPAGDDKVRLRAEVRLLGNPVEVTTVARVRVAGNRIRVTPATVTLGDGRVAAGALGSQLADRYTVSYRLGRLPQGVAVRRVVARDDGFHVTLVGSDVTFDATTVR